MIRPLAFVSVLALAISAVVTRAPASPVVDTPIVSAGVEVLGTIPEIGAIGGRVRRQPDGTRYMIMTSARGVSAYDVTIPEVPVLAGHLPLPHFENEDVDFGDDVLLVSQDPGFTTEAGGGLYILDISSLPAITFAYVNAATGNRFVEATAPLEGSRNPGHTTSCVAVPGHPRCSWAYVNGGSVIRILDLRDPADPRVAGTFSSPIGRTHDAQVDDDGIYWMVGSGGFAAYDTSHPDDPTLLGRYDPPGLDYHHNSWRPDARAWRVSRTDDSTVDAGETLLITEEDYLRPGCTSQGRFATAWLKGWDLGSPGGTMPETEVLDTWTPAADTFGLPTPAVSRPTPFGPVGIGESYNAPAVCSAHYFDERDGIVAIAWYEQGTRFLDVSDPSDIQQVGYYVSPGSVTWDVVWIGPGTEPLGGDEIAYSIDASRGIDILRFDRAVATRTVRAPLQQTVALPADALPHPVWGWACRVAVVG